MGEYKDAFAWAASRARLRLYRIRYANPPVYVRPIKLNPSSGRFDTAPVYETEYPYRPGTGAVIRVLGKYGVTFGVLDSHPSMDDDDIDDRLIVAIQSVNGPAEYQGAEREAWAERARWRRTIAGNTASQEEAALITDMLGLAAERA